MTKKELFKLKMSLLRIWLFKNTKVFVELLMYILVISLLTGRIGNNTLILNLIGLDDLSVAIDDTLTNDFGIGDMLLNLVYVVSSAIVVVGTISSHSKQLVLADIKKPGTKMMLLRAGLYFNKDGKLVKRIEEATKIDLDGDNKIGDSDVEITDLPRENIIKGLKRSTEEFITIVTINPESMDDVDDILKANDMADSAEALEKIDESVVATIKNVSATDVVNFAQSEDGQKVKETINTLIEGATPVVGTALKHSGTFFNKVGSGIKTSTFATGRFFKRIGTGILTGIGYAGKGVFKFGATIGGFVINTAKSFGGVIKNIFTKKDTVDQDAELARVLASKKSQHVPNKVQPTVSKPVVVKKKTASEIKLEELRKKYGQ